MQRSIPAFRKLITDRIIDIDENMRCLRDIRKLLCEKNEQMDLCEQMDLNSIEIVECKEDYLLLSSSIKGVDYSDDMQTFMEYTKDFRDHRIYNKNYGSMIAIDKIIKRDFEEYDYFFSRLSRVGKKPGLFHKPAGTYIRAFSKGDWDKIPDVYEKIISFAKENNLTLRGYAYEEGINEMVIHSMEEYIVQIMILCEKRGGTYEFSKNR